MIEFDKSHYKKVFNLVLSEGSEIVVENEIPLEVIDIICKSEVRLGSKPSFRNHNIGDDDVLIIAKPSAGKSIYFWFHRDKKSSNKWTVSKRKDGIFLRFGDFPKDIREETANVMKTIEKIKGQSYEEIQEQKFEIAQKLYRDKKEFLKKYRGKLTQAASQKANKNMLGQYEEVLKALGVKLEKEERPEEKGNITKKTGKKKGVKKEPVEKNTIEEKEVAIPKKKGRPKGSKNKKGGKGKKKS
jgi:hypothetical protein